MSVPCGQCMGCRLAKTADWATRICHEASLHENNCFITLTYNNEHLPENRTLVKSDLQKFFKRLRHYIKPHKIRYYASGEYGEDEGERPHYHAIIFNYWPEDCETYEETPYGTLYFSTKLAQIWGKGYCTIGACTYETAAYTASYVIKKITGKKSVEHYQGREPEFAHMSRRPGIASDWYDTWRDDTFKNNSIAIRGRERTPPQYYKKKYSVDNPDHHFKLKLESIRKQNDFERCQQIEKYLVDKSKYFKKNKLGD